MKKIPWKTVFIVCTVMTLLVIARCATTIGRQIYYGETNWAYYVRSDPWFYVGIAAAVAALAAFLTWRLSDKD